MKKLIALLLAVLALTGCAPSGIMEDGTIDYRVMDGWSDGEVITTIDGHIWEFESHTGYTGNVEVIFDAKGTRDVTDDIIIIVVENG